MSRWLEPRNRKVTKRSIITSGFAIALVAFGRRLILLAALVSMTAPAVAWAAGIDAQYPVVRQYFPGATRFGPISGNPPAANVYSGQKLLGYVFESRMVAPVPAYSGEPVNILIAIDRKGQIIGAKVLEQNEPILLVGIPVQRLYDFVARYVGHRVTDNIIVGSGGGAGSIHIDAISSATVTSMAVNQTIMDAAVKVAVARKLVAANQVEGAQAPARIRMDYYEKAGWAGLLGNGSIRRLHLTRGEVATAFGNMPAPLFPDNTTASDADAKSQTFIDLYYTLVTPPTVGRNLLGKIAYADLMKRLAPGDQAIAVVANGLYSFKGVGYVRGGIFDRMHVVQGRKVILFHDSDLVELEDPHLDSMPSFREMGIFIVRESYGFDPGQPWTLQLLVRRQIGPLKDVYTTFDDRYQIPAAFVVPAAPRAQGLESGAAPLWMKIWYQDRFQIAGLVAGLLLLSTILVFQDWFVRRPRLLERMRVGFLIYTTGFIGWYGLAQLSVVNILTFVHAVLHEFRWSTFLMDPLIFILWVFVAVTLLLFGRGVYCGWLCPFGALQSLISKVAKYLRVPQVDVPPFVHERLWAVKYIILLGLFGLSLQSVNLAERFAEVEPFKTAINLHFVRSWAFVAYAVALLAVSAFNSKFYCRYLCPLGAGLAVAGRHRLFEWLRRRPECGHPCHICANECEVQAISPLGVINPNECHYCLDCQITYWNDRKCPPLVHLRKRRECAGAAADATQTSDRSNQELIDAD
ncbi:MAG: regulatory protein NosR [Alphaproteobacteria bacterium]|nr:regulatory protein NosR [Alphaproteobacteria bacterium]